jgi:predicted RNase H-like HicB family nuclease
MPAGDRREGFRMLTIEVEREEDGRWIAEVTDLPSVLAYGQTRQEAIERVQALSLRVLADPIEHEESVPGRAQDFTAAP